MWTRFMDMHSGGSPKEKYGYIYIEAPEKEARVIFYNRFGHSPDRVTCTCCGRDYSYDEYPDLFQASGYDRGCEYAYFNTKGVMVPEEKAWVRGKGLKRGYTGKYIEKPTTMWGNAYLTLDQYKKYKDVLIIPKSEIRPDWRIGDVPEQGYVWRD